MKRSRLDARTGIALLIAVLVACGTTSAATLKPRERLEATESLLQNIGGNVVLTRAATFSAGKIGIEKFIKSKAIVSKVDGWKLVHLPEENIRVIQKRAADNLLAWRKATQSSLSAPMVLTWDAATKDAVQSVISRLCGVTINFEFDRPLRITVVTRPKQPAGRLCDGFPFILAANGVVLKESDGVLIGLLAAFTS